MGGNPGGFEGRRDDRECHLVEKMKRGGIEGTYLGVARLEESQGDIP